MALVGRLSFLQQPPWVSVQMEATILVARTVTMIVPQIQINQEIFMSIFSLSLQSMANTSSVSWMHLRRVRMEGIKLASFRHLHQHKKPTQARHQKQPAPAREHQQYFKLRSNSSPAASSALRALSLLLQSLLSHSIFLYSKQANFSTRRDTETAKSQ